MNSWLHGPIVVPLDGRESSLRATHVAARVAQLLEAPLRVVSVVEHEKDAGSRLAWLTDAARTILGDFETDVLVGRDVAATIVDAVSESGVVCMATAGRVSFHSGHFGSIAESVVRRLDRPIFLVGPHVDPAPSSGTRRIVVPVDGSALSTTAFAPAAVLATRLDVPLWIISIVSPGEIAARTAARGAPVEAPEYRTLPDLAAKLAADRNMTVEYEVINSETPAQAIVDFAGDDGTVVMSTHGRSGLSRVFAGSVAAGVVAHSRRPVAVLRPAAVD